MELLKTIVLASFFSSFFFLALTFWSGLCVRRRGRWFVFVIHVPSALLTILSILFALIVAERLMYLVGRAYNIKLLCVHLIFAVPFLTLLVMLLFKNGIVNQKHHKFIAMRLCIFAGIGTFITGSLLLSKL